MPHRSKNDKRLRICYSCNTTKSGTDGHGLECWIENKGTDLFLCTRCYDLIRRGNGRHAYQRMIRKSLSCYACGTTEARRRDGRINWSYNCDEDGKIIHLICISCYSAIFLEPYRIRFKTERPYVKEALRKGECQICHRTVWSGQIKVTNMHHEEYDPEHREGHTLELCARHHANLHKPFTSVNK